MRPSNGGSAARGSGKGGVDAAVTGAVATWGHWFNAYGARDVGTGRRDVPSNVPCRAVYARVPTGRALRWPQLVRPLS